MAKGVNIALGPGVNVAQIARGGRNAEYLGGESAHLAAVMAVEYIDGLQSTSVRAKVKHYGFNLQEMNRNYYSAQVDERAALEVYYPPFAAAARAGVAAVMCAYNLVNGTYACGAKKLLNRDLRERLGFKGFVMSDWWSVHDYGYQNAGLDMLMPGNTMESEGGNDFFSSAALQATSKPGVIDQVSKRVLRQMVQATPKCTPPHCDHLLLHTVATSDEYFSLARRIAMESIAMLKNRGGLLPLRPGHTGGARRLSLRCAQRHRRRESLRRFSLRSSAKLQQCISEDRFVDCCTTMRIAPVVIARAVFQQVASNRVVE